MGAESVASAYIVLSLYEKAQESAIKKKSREAFEEGIKKAIVAKRELSGVTSTEDVESGIIKKTIKEYLEQESYMDAAFINDILEVLNEELEKEIIEFLKNLIENNDFQKAEKLCDDLNEYFRIENNDAVTDIINRKASKLIEANEYKDAQALCYGLEKYFEIPRTVKRISLRIPSINIIRHIYVVEENGELGEMLSDSNFEAHLTIGRRIKRMSEEIDGMDLKMEYKIYEEVEDEDGYMDLERIYDIEEVKDKSFYTVKIKYNKEDIQREIKEGKLNLAKEDNEYFIDLKKKINRLTVVK